MRASDDLLRAVVVGVGAAIKATKLVVEDAGELNIDGCVTWRELRGNGEALGVFVKREIGRPRIDEHARHLELDGVQHNSFDALGDFDVDADGASK